MISISVFMVNTSNLLQALTIVLVLFIALYMQYSQNPYNTKQLNFMELEAVTTATVTIYCGLYYLSKSLDSYFQTLLFCVILFGNLYFIIYWLYYMFKAILDLVIRVMPILRQRFKRGDAFSDNFYEEKISMKGTYIDPSDGVRKPTFLSSIKKKAKGKLHGVEKMEDIYKMVMNNKANNTNSDSYFDQESVADELSVVRK